MKKEVENIMSLVSEYLECLGGCDVNKWVEYERQIREAENELYSKGYGFKIKFNFDGYEPESTMIRINGMMFIGGDTMFSGSTEIDLKEGSGIERVIEKCECDDIEYKIEAVKLF